MKLLLRVWFWIKNFATCQILNKKICNASDFESEYLHRVRFWIRIFFKKHDFEEKNILNSTILKKICTQKSRFDSICPVKCAIFAFYVQF